MSPSIDSSDGETGSFRLLSREGAEKALDRLRESRPDLWAAPRRRGCLRGIDVFSAQGLPDAFRGACNNFRAAHGRFPALINPQTTADHWFTVKFFHDIPLRPINPADKLTSPLFMSEETRRQVGYPDRVWISEEPRLPGDDEVPPGDYWLKISNASAMQTRLRWPPSPEEREVLLGKIEKWWPKNFGLVWGEWWYSLCKRRIYLETDVSTRMAGRPEVKIFVRDGVPKLLYAIRLRDDGRHEQAYFDADLNRLEGRSPPNLPLEDELPDTIELMLRGAAEIGRRFRVCRIDFLNLAGGQPGFGEITICHNNARKNLSPAGFDDWARQLLFE